MKIFFAKSETARPFTASETKFILTTLNDARSWLPRKWSETKSRQHADYILQLESQEYINMLPGMKGLSVTFMQESPRRTLLSYENWCNVPAPLRHVYSLAQYRIYLINHETGHGLGLGHTPRRPNDLSEAPVMIQQTNGLSSYRPNVWPLQSELNRFEMSLY